MELNARDIITVGRNRSPWFRRAADRLLGLDTLAALYARLPADARGAEFLQSAVDEFDVRIEVDDADLRRVPETGPLIVVANHPFGGIEGLVLGLLLCERRPDTKIMANYLLGRIPQLRDLFLEVDPFEGRAAKQRNVVPIRKALRWVASGNCLIVFPAGEVASLQPRSRRVVDPAWNPLVGGIARRSGARVLPVFFDGHNGALFQLLGLVHPRLRTAWLPRAILARRGRAIGVRIGSAITPEQLRTYDSDPALVDYLRSRSEILRDRSPEPIQPRRTPRISKRVVDAAPARQLQLELDRLPPEQCLVDGGDQTVHVASAAQIPGLLREIGRLRELTFREVGEGTGREIDLDRFDEHYEHLFIWNRRSSELVGAYRLGRTDELLRRHGLGGLYTSTLFSYRSRLFEAMGPAIEMGRSFVRPEYQKSYNPLMLLWKGIGQYVMRHPTHPILFGPVSVSAEYRSASQRLIVSFLSQNSYAHDWSRWVRPRTPWRSGSGRSANPGPGQLRDLDDVSRFISEIESDQKGVPILLKQYLKLGGRLLGFNVDPGFSNVLDVLLLVDLRQTSAKILGRYMGRDGATRFLERQHSRRPAAG